MNVVPNVAATPHPTCTSVVENPSMNCMNKIVQTNKTKMLATLDEQILLIHILLAII